MPVVIPDLRVNRIGGTDKTDGLNGALVVGATALGHERTGASTLEVDDLRVGSRCIARELLIVDTETVTLGIGIDEETSLEEGIRRRLNVRDHVGWRETQLVYRQYHDVR